MTKTRKPQSIEDYGFSGVFIPANIWLSDKVKRNEVLLLMEISALSQGRACTASNQFLADHLDIEVRRVQQMLAKLVRLGLVVREVEGPFRHLWVDPVELAAFDREPTMQKIACLPRKKLHGNHVINCTQGRRGEKNRDRSTPLNVENGESRPGSASSLVSGQGRDNALGSSEGGGPPAPTTGQAGSASDRATETRQGGKQGSRQNASKTPQGAPWAGKDYRQAVIPEILDYADLEAITDPIRAAIAATDDRSPGGYGFWIKVLNFAVEDGMPLEQAIRVFMNCVVIIYGQNKSGELTNPAAALSNMVKDVFAWKGGRA